MMVINVETGEMTYDNLPQEVEEMYYLAHPEGALLGEETPEVESVELQVLPFQKTDCML